MIRRSSAEDGCLKLNNVAVAFVLFFASLSIASGKITDSVAVSPANWFSMPVIMYTPETKLGLGTGVGYYYRQRPQLPSIEYSNSLDLHTERSVCSVSVARDIYIRWGKAFLC